MLLMHLTDINQRIDPNTVPTLSDQSVWFYDFSRCSWSQIKYSWKKTVLNQVKLQSLIYYLLKKCLFKLLIIPMTLLKCPDISRFFMVIETLLKYFPHLPLLILLSHSLCDRLSIFFFLLLYVPPFCLFFSFLSFIFPLILARKRSQCFVDPVAEVSLKHLIE